MCIKSTQRISFAWASTHRLESKGGRAREILTIITEDLKKAPLFCKKSDEGHGFPASLRQRPCFGSFKELLGVRAT